MFNLWNVPQFVIDCFNQGFFSEEQTVRDRRQSPFHIAFEFGNEFIPSTKSRLKSARLIYPLSPTNLPYMNLMKGIYSNVRLSSTSPVVNIKFRSSPFSLQIRLSLKPKTHPMEHLPLAAIPLKTLCISILWLRHTLRGMLSTILIPVHLPSKIFLMKIVKGRDPFFSNSTKRL